MYAVMHHELGTVGVQLIRSDGGAGGVEGALKQMPHAKADQLAEFDRGHRPVASAGQDEIQRAQKIGRGIDQRAVEVEKHGNGGLGHGSGNFAWGFAYKA